MSALTRDWALELLTAAAEALMPRSCFVRGMTPDNRTGLDAQRCPSMSGRGPVIGLPVEELPPGAIASVTQMALERRSFHTLRARMPSGVRGWATPRRSMGIAVKGNPSAPELLPGLLRRRGATRAAAGNTCCCACPRWRTDVNRSGGVVFHVKQTATGRRIHGRRAVAKGEGTGHIGGRCPHAARSFVHLPARTLEEAAV